MKSKIKNAYNLLGDHYYRARKTGDGVSRFYNESLEMPTTLKLLGNVKGKKILDLGCGPGIYAKILTDKGAKVKGIDNSETLIEIARKEAPKAKLTLGDIEKLPYKNKEFDIIFASLVLGHFASWDKILSEVRRVLKNGGIFIFSNNNPVTNALVKEKKFFIKSRAIKDYFKEGWKTGTWGGDGKSAKIFHHHKRYGTIVKFLVNNGFEIIDYEDCKPLPSSKKKFSKHYERASNMPHFCVWKVRKK